MEEKYYFKPGDIVRLRQNIECPNMLVLRKETLMFKGDKDTNLKGLRCRWFTKNHEMQESVFSTKDLILVEE